MIDPQISIGIIGVSLNVLGGCALGTFASFSVGERVEHRGLLFYQGVSALIMGAGFTAGANFAVSHFTKFELTPPFQAFLGITVSFCTRFVLPGIADWLRQNKWLKLIPWIKDTD